MMKKHLIWSDFLVKTQEVTPSTVRNMLCCFYKWFPIYAWIMLWCRSHKPVAAGFGTMPFTCAFIPTKSFNMWSVTGGSPETSVSSLEIVSTTVCPSRTIPNTAKHICVQYIWSIQGNVWYYVRGSRERRRIARTEQL